MSTDSALSMETKARPWWLLLIEGIAAIIVGILLIQQHCPNSYRLWFKFSGFTG